MSSVDSDDSFVCVAARLLEDATLRDQLFARWLMLLTPAAPPHLMDDPRTDFEQAWEAKFQGAAELKHQVSA
jgi:hypothetical protein